MENNFNLKKYLNNNILLKESKSEDYFKSYHKNN